LVAFASTGKIDTTEYHLSIIPSVTLLEPNDTLQFLETIPSAANRWQFKAQGRDPSRLDQMWSKAKRFTVFMFEVLDDLHLPEFFQNRVRGESEWTLHIEGPWFGPEAVPNDAD
jgi:hypothetical protein